MQKVLCYGDSNTYGFNPINGLRFSEDERWSGILKNNLTDRFEVIEKGLNNRTGFVDNPQGEKFSAKSNLPKTLQQIRNIDLLILAVGTNDLQTQYNIDFKTIELGLENLILKVKNQNIKTIIISPVILRKEILKSFFGQLFDEVSIQKSVEVQKVFEKVARKLDCEFFDCNKLVSPSTIDGLHYTADAHKKIAENLIRLL